MKNKTNALNVAERDKGDKNGGLPEPNFVEKEKNG